MERGDVYVSNMSVGMHGCLRYGTFGAYSVCMGNNTKVRALVAFGLAVTSAGVALFILSYAI